MASPLTAPDRRLQDEGREASYRDFLRDGGMVGRTVEGVKWLAEDKLHMMTGSLSSPKEMWNTSLQQG